MKKDTVINTKKHPFIFFVLLFVLCFVGKVSSQQLIAANIADINLFTDKEKILIFSSSGNSNGFSSSIERIVRKNLDADNKYAIFTSYIDLYNDKSLESFERKSSEIKSLIDEDPYIVILLDEDAWIFYRQYFQNEWKNTIVIVAFEGDFTTSFEDYMSGKEITKDMIIPLNHINKDSNTCILHSIIPAKKNIDLMLSINPNINKIVLISDYKQAGKVARWRVKSAIDSYFPKLELETLNSADIASDKLIDTIQAYNKNVGILFHSWRQSRKDRSPLHSYSSILYNLANFSKTPIYTMFDNDIDENGFIGGYYIERDVIGDRISEIIKDLTENNKNPEGIYLMDDVGIYINYKNMLKYNIDSSILPSDTIFFQKPASFWQLYGHIITAIIFILSILIMWLFLFVIILRIKKKRAERENKLKNILLSNISYEIKTPLNAIIGFADMILSDKDATDQEKAEYMKAIMDNRELLVRFVEDFATLTQIESYGVNNINIKEESLNSIMENVESVIKIKARNSNIDILFKNKDDNDFIIRTDRDKLTQIMLQLLNNALRFTEKGHIHFGYIINIDHIYFYIEDTGCGIPAEEMTGIFDCLMNIVDFEHIGGLGLAISKAIVTKMGGKIGAESEFGKGSTFWFVLPLNS